MPYHKASKNSKSGTTRAKSSKAPMSRGAPKKAAGGYKKKNKG